MTVLDVGTNEARHQLVAAGRPCEFDRITGSVTDADAVHEAMAGADRVIHLAALQVPFCRANPTLGAEVNVVGTVNVFEAALAHGIGPVVYASSVAVYGAPDDYPDPVLRPEDRPLPRTLYGAYKVANEHTAAIYCRRERAGVGGPAAAHRLRAGTRPRPHLPTHRRDRPRCAGEAVPRRLRHRPRLPVRPPMSQQRSSPRRVLALATQPAPRCSTSAATSWR